MVKQNRSRPAATRARRVSTSPSRCPRVSTMSGRRVRRTTLRNLIAADDFLLQGAQATADAMEQNGHHVDFVIASCSGHCCMNSPSDAEEALSWFLDRTKCHSTDGVGCSSITALP